MKEWPSALVPNHFGLAAPYRR